MIDGADRSVTTESAQAGILKKITYPTKGTTEFFYESNAAKGITHEDENLGMITAVKKNSVSLENVGGHNNAFGPSFNIFQSGGVTVHVDADIAYKTSASCTVNSPASGGSFFDCMNITLEKRGANSQFTVYDSQVHFNNDYTLAPGEYRVTLTWNAPLQVGSIANVNLTWVDGQAPQEQFINPADDLVGMISAQAPNTGAHVQLQNTNGNDVGYTRNFKIIGEGLTQVLVESHIMYGAQIINNISVTNPSCTVTSPDGVTGSFWECMTISLEEHGADGNWHTNGNGNATLYI